MLIKKYEKQFTQIIHQYFQPEFLIVVGSFAKGTEHPRSDIDIVYYTQHIISVEDRATLIGELEALSGREVDLIDFNYVDDAFSVHVLTEGLPIYIRDAKDFNQFKALIVNQRT